MSKKHRSIIIAVAVIIVVVLLMFNANSKSPFVRQLRGPTEGTDGVLTIGDKLFVISKDNHVFTWQWNALKIWPIVAKPQASAITPIANDKIAYAASANAGRLIITNPKADKEISDISLPYGAQCKAIKPSQNGKFGIVSVDFKGGIQKGLFKLGVFNEKSKEPSFVFQKDTNAENFAIYDFAITNNGNLLAGAGGKDNAWFFVSDVNTRSVLWEKTFDKYDKFTCAEFSPDGKLLFIAEKVRHILVLNAATGELLKEFVMDEYKTPSNQKQNISCIDISPDGKFLAVDTEPAGTVWFWNIASGSKIGKIHASALTVSDIVFSPDSKFLATGCLVRPEIKIWKVPQPNK